MGHSNTRVLSIARRGFGGAFRLLEHVRTEQERPSEPPPRHVQGASVRRGIRDDSSNSVSNMFEELELSFRIPGSRVLESAT